MSIALVAIRRRSVDVYLMLVVCRGKCSSFAPFEFDASLVLMWKLCIYYLMLLGSSDFRVFFFFLKTYAQIVFPIFSSSHCKFHLFSFVVLIFVNDLAILLLYRGGLRIVAF